MISFILWIIKSIITFLINCAIKFGTYTILFFKKYTTQAILTLLALIFAFLTVRHCKYGLFIGCKDTVIHNNFTKPCKIYQTFNAKELHLKEKSCKECKIKVKKQ